MRRLGLILVVSLVATSAYAQNDTEGVLIKHAGHNWLSTCWESLSDSWTCSSGGTTCNAAGAGQALSDGDVVLLQDGGSIWRSYSVNGSNAGDITTFERLDSRELSTYAAITTSALYRASGLHATAECAVYDGDGNASPLELSQDGVGSRLDVADAKFVGLGIVNSDEPDDTDTGQSASMTFGLFGTENGGTSFQEYTVAEILAYKTDDFYNSNTTEHDSALAFRVMNNGSLETKLTLDQGGALTGISSRYLLDTDEITVGNASTFGFASTVAATGAKDLILSRHDDGETFLEGDDDSGTASDGTATLRWAGQGFYFGDLDTYIDENVDDKIRFRFGGTTVGQLDKQWYSWVFAGSVSAGDRTSFKPSGGATALTDSDGQQASFVIQDYVNQSGTAALDFFELDALLTSLGDGSTGDGNNLLNLKADSTSVFRVDTTGFVDFPAREYCYTVPVSRAFVGATTPTPVLLGTYYALGFDADAETVNITLEIPPEWDGASDLTLKVYWFAESGDQIANGETVIWDVSLRSITEGEPYDNGSTYDVSGTYTETANPADDKLFVEQEITLVYNNANQPFAAGDTIGIVFNRDVTSDTYSGDAQVFQWELCGNVTSYPTHF